MYSETKMPSTIRPHNGIDAIPIMHVHVHCISIQLSILSWGYYNLLATELWFTLISLMTIPYSRTVPGFFSKGVQFLPSKLQKYLSTFKQMLAVCICLTNVTGSNHEEVSTNRDTWFFSTLSYIFPLDRPWKHVQVLKESVLPCIVNTRLLIIIR